MSKPLLPPQDLSAEQGVLGGCLVHGADVVALVSDILEEGDFHNPRHEKIFLAINQLWDRGEPVDETTVTGWLNDSGGLQYIGGPIILAELADIAIAPAHVEHYAKLVHDKAILRQMLNELNKAAREVCSERDPDELLNRVQASINRLSEKAHVGQLLSNRQVVGKVFADLQERMKQGRDPNAVSWGLSELDRVTGGMQPGDLIVPAGRPSMGKTSFALRSAGNLAIRQGLPVLFASGEQTENQLVSWLICSEAKINTQNWRTGRVSTVELANAKMKREVIERAPLYWLPGGAGGIRGIEARARSIQARHGKLGMVVVDYIQRYARSSKEEHVSNTSKELKDMAMALRVPVMALSQLNRKVEDRDPPKPRLADLRGSGAIEQDTDIVLLFYRPAYYDKHLDGEERLVHVGVAKNRGGPRGELKLYFTPEYVRFDDEDTNQQGAMF